MKIIQYSRIGRGVYTLSESYRLTRVPIPQIRRWAAGYCYNYKGQTICMPPIIATEAEPINGTPTLDFSDLIEIRFLNAFRNKGVSWKSIRIAADKARSLLRKTHPFSTQIFKTDGRTILAEIIGQNSKDKNLLDVVRDQFVFQRVIEPYLYFGLEFNQDKEPSRWWPLGENRSVVIDPQRSFGAPIINRGGIPTKILYKAVAVEDSINSVASWFDVDPDEVNDAVDFERQLAA